MRSQLVTWLGVALSGALLVLLAQTFDVRETLTALSLAKPAWLAAGAFVYTLLFVVRGYRWSLFLTHLKPLSTRTATEVYAVGFFANNVLPARLGDVARAFVLAKREKLPIAGTFSSVLLERIFDGVTVVFLMSLVLWLAPPKSAWIQPFSWIAATIFVTAIAVCAWIAANPASVRALIGQLFGWLPGQLLPKIQGLVERLSMGLSSLTSGARTVQISGLSCAVWLIETSVYILVARAYNLDVPPLGMILVMAVLTLGLTVPSAPGFLGVFEGLVVKALELFGVTGPQAFAFAVTLHLIHFLPGTILGLVFSLKSGLRLRELATEPAFGGEAAARPTSRPH